MMRVFYSTSAAVLLVTAGCSSSGADGDSGSDSNSANDPGVVADGDPAMGSDGGGAVGGTQSVNPGTGGAEAGTGGAETGTGGAEVTPAPVGQIGLFSSPEDIFCPHFDTKPDLDDVHAQAAVASVIAHPSIAGIDVFAVVGAYGSQDGAFVDSSAVMDLGFPGNWTSTTGDGYSWEAASDQSAARMIIALKRGGDVWIAEAGQSDFSYDAIQKAIAALPDVDTQRFHIVQHSTWNEEVSDQAKLGWLRANVDYIHIQDGNFPDNGTPDFKTFPEEITPADTMLWEHITSDAALGPLWTEAKQIADQYNPIATYNNTAIQAGGFDFSDCSEVIHIFGYQGAINDHVDFFDTFVP